MDGLRIPEKYSRMKKVICQITHPYMGRTMSSYQISGELPRAIVSILVLSPLAFWGLERMVILSQ